jgi:hypothetical protein
MEPLITSRTRESKMNRMKTRLVFVTAILIIATTFVSSTFAAHSTRKSEKPVTPASECIRLLVSTSHRLVDNIIVPKTIAEKSFIQISEKRAKLLNAFDEAMIKGHTPSIQELTKLFYWIESFFKIAVQLGIYNRGTEESRNLSVSLSLAQGYLDCARHMNTERK